MHFSFLVQVHDGEMEQPVIFLRKHPVILFGASLLYLGLIAAPIAAWAVLGEAVGEWLAGPTLGPVIVLLAALYELFVLLLFYTAFMDWYLDIWVVTKERIVDVDQSGVFGRHIAELQLSKVQDVAAETRGVFATLFRYGTIRVQSAGERTNFEFHGIANPYEVSKRIIELVQADQRWHQAALAQQIKAVV